MLGFTKQRNAKKPGRQLATAIARSRLLAKQSVVRHCGSVPTDPPASQAPERGFKGHPSRQPSDSGGSSGDTGEVPEMKQFVRQLHVETRGTGLSEVTRPILGLGGGA